MLTAITAVISAIVSGFISFTTLYVAINIFGRFESLRMRRLDAKKSWPIYAAAAQYGLPLLVFVLSFVYLMGFTPEALAKVSTGGMLGRAVVFSMVAMTGVLLYFLRKFERRVYALLELAVAMVTMAGSMNRLSEWQELAAWTPLAGSVYLLVRALDNLEIGIKTAEDEHASWQNQSVESDAKAQMSAAPLSSEATPVAAVVHVAEAPKEDSQSGETGAPDKEPRGGDEA